MLDRKETPGDARIVFTSLMNPVFHLTHEGVAGVISAAVAQTLGSDLGPQVELEDAAVRSQKRAIFENARESGFDVADYAERRRRTEPWVTVEIGPGTRPSGLNRKYVTESQSAYIGIEALLNSKFSEHSEEHFAGLRDEGNIFLLTDRLISRQPLDADQEIDPADTRHCVVPDEIADEVFIVYNYDDPRTDQALITQEALRMLKPGGLLIIHDSNRELLNIVGYVQSSGFQIVYAIRKWSAFENTEEPAFNAVVQSLGLEPRERGANPFNDRPGLLIIAEKPGITSYTGSRG